MSENQDELRQKRLARLQAFDSAAATEADGTNMDVSDAPQKIARTAISEEVKPPETSKPVELIGDMIEKPSLDTKNGKEISAMERLLSIFGYIFEIDQIKLKSFPMNSHSADEAFLKMLSQFSIFYWLSTRGGQKSRLSNDILELTDKKIHNDLETLHFLSCCFSRCMAAKFGNGHSKGVVKSTILNFIVLLVNGGLGDVAYDCDAFYYLYTEKIIDGNFLMEIFGAANDPSVVDKICHPILNKLYLLVSSANLANQSFRFPVELLAELCALKLPNSNIRPFCSSLVRIANWLPDTVSKDHGSELKASPGMELQVLSYLGAFFQLSTFAEDDVSILYECYAFEEPSQAQMNMTQTGLASNAENLRRYLHEIIHLMLVNLESRSPILNYIVAVLERSWKRRQQHFEYRLVGSDGFILNWLYVLQKLCMKIKVDRVSKNYLWHPKCRIARLLKNDDARIRFNKQEFEQFLDERVKGPEDEADPSFSTECFYLTAFIHHIGIVSIVRRFNNRNRAVHELKSTKAKLEKKTEEGEALTKEETRQLKLVKLELGAIRRMGLSIMGSLSDPCLIDQTIYFLNTFCSFLMSYVFPDPQNISAQFSSISPSDLPSEFQALPEFFFENIVEWLFYYARMHPVELSQSLVTDIITWFTLFLSNTALIKNLFLTARMVETLFMLCPMSPRHPTERLFTTVVMAPIALAGLVPSLMKFYVDCELTGSHTEFFDKFNIRYHISVIFRQIWNLIEYKTAIIKEAQTARTAGAQSVFVRFVNMLINDCTFFLDESMQLLKQIHEIEQLQNDQTEWNKLNEEQKKAKLELMVQDQRIVPQYLNLGDDNLRMFYFLTKDSQEAFLVPEIVDKLAAMLNYNLAQLCGKRCSQLKVDNPDKYNWKPKELLEHIIQVYLNLDCDKFANAVAGDERSFSSDLFPGANRVVQKTGILSSDEADQFRSLGVRVMAISKERLQEEVDLGEPPDNFRDALMDTLMVDPVQLPSGKVCDRTVVSRLLLDRPEDPFNRASMTEEDLIPLPDLKKEIADWIKSRKAELRQAKS